MYKLIVLIDGKQKFVTKDLYEYGNAVELSRILNHFVTNMASTEHFEFSGKREIIVVEDAVITDAQEIFHRDFIYLIIT